MQSSRAKVLHHLGGQYRLAFADGLADPGKTLFEAAVESGAQVRGFHPSARTLEDIFLEAVE